MIEAAREMLDLIKHMPQYTLWVLLGILFYKVFIIGSWITLARLLIIKVYDGYISKINKKPDPIEYEVGGILLSSSARPHLDVLLKTVIKLNKYGTSYLHQGEIIDAIQILDKEINNRFKKDNPKNPFDVTKPGVI